MWVWGWLEGVGSRRDPSLQFSSTRGTWGGEWVGVGSVGRGAGEQLGGCRPAARPTDEPLSPEHARARALRTRAAAGAAGAAGGLCRARESTSKLRVWWSPANALACGSDDLGVSEVTSVLCFEFGPACVEAVGLMV